MEFNIITIFPHVFESYFNESIVSRAQKKNLVKIKIHNLRDCTSDKHRTVDDTPYGGGAGMIMKVEPIYRAVQALSSKLRNRIILFSAKGNKYTQADARRLSKYKNLILICGRYEGVDERVAKHIADEEISIGDYILTGGEIPAMVLTDSIIRLIPGVLGNPKSLEEESFGSLQATSYLPARFARLDSTRLTARRAGEAGKLKANLEYPQYTKPEEFNGWKVPKVLLSGNHKEIKGWKERYSKKV